MAKRINYISLRVLMALVLSTHVTYSQTWRRVFKLNKNKATPDFPNNWYNERGGTTFASFAAEETFLATAAGQSLSIANTNFKSILIIAWMYNLITVDRVRLNICKDNVTQKQIIFDASSSTFNSWLSVPNIISSSWTDLSSSIPYQPDWVGINTTWRAKSFAIMTQATSCSDWQAFFLIHSTYSFCREWGREQNKLGILYSNTSTLGSHTLEFVGVEADTFIMDIEYEAAITNPTPQQTKHPTHQPTKHPTLASVMKQKNQEATIPKCHWIITLSDFIIALLVIIVLALSSFIFCQYRRNRRVHYGQGHVLVDTIM